jgi:Spy/CpxP family protein refolding chaperone
VQWLPHIADARRARRDTARTAWISRDTVRWSPSLEAGRPTASALQESNGNSPFADYLFPPELVMQHQARLKLTEQQRDAIVAEINKLQATAVQAQWRVGDESEKLAELLRRETVSETDVLAQAERLIAQETAVKRAQLSMLIRIRNVLTPEQREVLISRRKAPKE